MVAQALSDPPLPRLEYCDEAVRDPSQAPPVDVHQPPAFLHKLLQLAGVRLHFEELPQQVGRLWSSRSLSPSNACPCWPWTHLPFSTPSDRVHSPSWPTLCRPLDCSQPGSSVHGIFQARILEQVAISYSKGFSQPRDRTTSLLSPTLVADSLPLVPPGKHHPVRWVIS